MVSNGLQVERIESAALLSRIWLARDSGVPSGATVSQPLLQWLCLYGRGTRRQRSGHPQLLEETQEIRDGPVVHNFTIEDTVDEQEHEADRFASRRDAHEGAEMGAAQSRHAANQLSFHQFDLNGMREVGKGRVQMGQMLARLMKSRMAVEDGPVMVIKGAEDVSQDVLRGWC